MTINYKIAVIGDSETGKTTFCRRNARLQFIEHYIPTEGAKQYSETIPRQADMPPFMFDINDVSGREEDKILLPTHVNPAMAVLLFFDLSKPETLKHLKQDYLDNKTIFPSDQEIAQHRILIGNLPTSKTQSIDQSEIDKLKQDYHLDYFQIDANNTQSFKNLKSSLTQGAITYLKHSPDYQKQIEEENKRFEAANKKYKAIWDPSNPRESIKRILNDYAKNNSFFMLAFSFHLNRHHVKEVDAIAKSINDNTDFKAILDQLNQINKSPSGTLAEITTFLCHKLDHISAHVVEQEIPSRGLCFFC